MLELLQGDKGHFNDKFEDDAMGQIDDDQDRVAMTPGYLGDKLGRNHITGRLVTENDNGMNDEHSYFNPVMGRNFVKSPGYTTQDSSGWAGEYKGHIYLGSGRRRIGSGYGRRRAPVLHKLSEKEQKKVDKLPIFHQEKKNDYMAMWKMINSEYDKPKATFKTTKLKQSQVKALVREMLGIKNGPAFFSHINFRGSQWNPGKSMPAARNLDGSMNRYNLVSLHVPHGWCVTLYDKPNFAGVKSKKLCGPTGFPDLGFIPLTKTFGGEGKTNQAARAKVTDWKGNVRSFTFEQYEYTREKPTLPCLSKCGPKHSDIPSSTLIGKVVCVHRGGAEAKKVVDASLCDEHGLTLKQPLEKLCPGVPCQEMAAKKQVEVNAKEAEQKNIEKQAAQEKADKESRNKMLEQQGKEAVAKKEAAEAAQEAAKEKAKKTEVEHKREKAAKENAEKVREKSSKKKKAAELQIKEGQQKAKEKASKPRDTLAPGQVLHAGQQLSGGHGHRLVMQSDGNLVLYCGSGHVAWSTHTGGNHGAVARFQHDGNLVVYAHGGHARWNSGPKGGAARLTLQGDGNLVTYNSHGHALWSTGSHCQNTRRRRQPSSTRRRRWRI